MTTSDNLNKTHIEQSQSQKEVTNNEDTDRDDLANNDFHDEDTTPDSPPVTTFVITEANFLDNFTIRATGSPSATITLKLPDNSNTRNRIFAAENASGETEILDTVTGVSATSTITLLDGESAIVQMRGRELRVLAWLKKTAHIPLPLEGLREIASNDIDTSANHGGILTSNSTPTYARVDGATDKALRVLWVNTNVDEVQFPPIPMPNDLDAGQDLTIHLLVQMESTNDTPTIDVQVFDGVGDTEMGGATAALSDTLAEVSVTIANANISGHPLGFLNISLIPGAHGTDDLYLYAAWIEYLRVTS